MPLLSNFRLLKLESDKDSSFTTIATASLGTPVRGTNTQVRGH